MKIPEVVMIALTNGMFRFGTVNGNFDANYQNFGKDLKGSPRIVTGKFNIKDNNKLFTCEGGPDKGIFYCTWAYCTSLEGYATRSRIVYYVH